MRRKRCPNCEKLHRNGKDGRIFEYCCKECFEKDFKKIDTLEHQIEHLKNIINDVVEYLK